jgi:3-hydroxy-9,10-secoandrosta-1,3,5(10)-triene-9,17-dione monooxygenase
MTAVLNTTDDTTDISRLPTVELRQILVERASRLQPLLEKNAATTEANRRVAEENLLAIRDADLLKIAVPKRFGGLETDIRTIVEVSRELGRGCGSTAWVVTLNNSASRILGMANAEAQHDVWGNGPNASLFGSFPGVSTAKRVSGGILVSGRWTYASGCLHAHWGLLGVPLLNESGEVIGKAMGLFPASSLVIEDTWHSAGMKGSGSNTIVANEIFLPEHRISSMAAMVSSDTPTPYKDEALYRSSFFPSFPTLLLGPLLGMASRALEYVIEKASQKGIVLTAYQPQASSTGFQSALGRASILIQTAHLHTYRAADVIDQAARDGIALSYPERARLRMDAAHAAECVVKAIDLLMYAHGSSSFMEESPLQRIWRDVATASRHAVLLPEVGAEAYGRSLLGVTESMVTFV